MKKSNIVLLGALGVVVVFLAAFLIFLGTVL